MPEPAGGPDGEAQSDQDADEHHSHALAEDRRQHAERGGADRHANTDLPRTPRDREGQRSVEPQRRQDECQRAGVADRHRAHPQRPETTCQIQG